MENSIRNHSEERMEKIKELGDELIEHECMADSIRADIESLTERWNLLQNKVNIFEEKSKILMRKYTVQFV